MDTHYSNSEQRDSSLVGILAMDIRSIHFDMYNLCLPSIYQDDVQQRFRSREDDKRVGKMAKDQG